MNNVICVMVDSVFSDCVGPCDGRTSATPFIDSLTKEGLFAPNVYSYGPYTDAASNALYTFRPTLDDFGYYYGINSADNNHFKHFKESGYETYGFCYPFYLFGAKVRRYIDHPVITSGFKYQSEWFGKYELYAKKHKDNGLSTTEYKLLKKHVDLMFDCWISMYELRANEASRKLNDIIVSKDEITSRQKLNHEYTQYLSDKEAYIDSMLKLGMAHPLAKVNDIELVLNHEFINTNIYQRHKSFFKQLKMKTVSNALKINTRDGVKALISLFDRRSRYAGNLGLKLGYVELEKHRSLHQGWQEFPSFKRQIDVLLDMLKTRNPCSVPFYASLHPEEPHHNIAFFSYDCLDINELDEEFCRHERLLRSLGRGEKGNPSYLLSLNYIDYCIEYLFNRLKELGILETTTVLLIADHGTSYYMKNIRNTVVNNFHRENYNIPMLIWEKNMPSEFKGVANSFYMSDDVFPTLCSLVGIQQPNRENDIIITPQSQGREYVITEYMGPGCPDMLHGDIWISVRTDTWLLAYKTPIDGVMMIDSPVAIYNLQNDQDELKNLVGKITVRDEDELLKLARLVFKRVQEIQDGTAEIVNNLDALNVI